MRSRLALSILVLGSAIGAGSVLLSSCGSGLSDRLASGGDGPFAVVVGNFSEYDGNGTANIAVINEDGSLFEGFDGGSGFDSGVSDVEVLSDGSIVAVGLFTQYKGQPADKVVRLTAAGDIHPNFDSSLTIAGGMVASVMEAQDGTGDLIIGGAFTTINGADHRRIARLNRDGTVDTFNLSICDGSVQDVMADPVDPSDVWITGTFTQFDDALNCGSPFVPGSRLMKVVGNGNVIIDFSGSTLDNEAYVLAPAGGGSTDIYVGGAFTQFNSVTRTKVVRIESDGDAGIGSSPPQFGALAFDDAAYAIARAADGSGALYLGGPFLGSTQGGTSGSSDKNHLTKLDSSGTIDSTFSANLGNSFSAQVRTLVPLSDGDLLVGGDFSTLDGNPVRALTRLNSDGSLDAGFVHSLAAPGGIVIEIALF